MVLKGAGCVQERVAKGLRECQLCEKQNQVARIVGWR